MDKESVYLRGIKSAIKVDWDCDTQWDVRFQGYNLRSPFQNWLPVTELTIDMYKMTDLVYSAGNLTGLSVPLNIARGGIECTFLDSNGIIKEWFEDWIRLIYPSVGVVACLGDKGVVRKLVVAELGLNRVIRSERIFDVRVSESFSIRRGSQGELQQYSVKFKIHGVSDFMPVKKDTVTPTVTISNFY
jgi:hypothetical protein